MRTRETILRAMMVTATYFLNREHGENNHYEQREEERTIERCLCSAKIK